MEITRLCAIEVAKAIRSKTISVKEVVSAHLERAHEINPKINGLTQIIDESLEQAEQMDQHHPGQDAPPLWGVPVTTKVNVDQAGFATTNGVAGCMENSGVLVRAMITAPPSLRLFTTAES